MVLSSVIDKIDGRFREIPLNGKTEQIIVPPSPRVIAFGLDDE